MTEEADPLLSLSMHPLIPERWDDLEALFGERGGCGGCWCMTWRLSRAQFVAQKGAGNKHAFHAVVAAGDVPGVLAYINEVPVGWCAIAPRADYPALARSRILRPVDDASVWSISCFFVARPFRRRGVSVRLLIAATEYAQEQGARIVEGYPVEPRTDAATMPDTFAWTGLAAAFRAAGFAEVARRSDTRPIMRRVV